MTEREELDERIRRRVRRSGGMAQGGLSNSTAAHGQSVADNVDEDYPDLNAAIEAAAGNVERFVPPRVDDEFTPINRMRTVKGRSAAYEREYRLQLLHRMLMRRVPLDEIARELDVSVQTILKDRQELYHRLRDEAKKLDINHLVGDTVGFYTEVQGMALRAASNAKSPLNLRLAALRTALSSKNDMHRFLAAAGVYDVLRYKATEDQSADDISKLIELTKTMLNTADSEFEKVAETLPPLPNMEDDDEDGVEELQLHLL